MTELLLTDDERELWDDPDLLLEFIEFADWLLDQDEDDAS